MAPGDQPAANAEHRQRRRSAALAALHAAAHQSPEDFLRLDLGSDGNRHHVGGNLVGDWPPHGTRSAVSSLGRW